ncbi:dihydroneopterin aldolase [Maribius pontilimi]|uniref:Dihydroneopterin aldolase n=1 Tax=Palleronia pontilimi TaxID=1964209 RepID=A0A934IJ36_9RHOB|nr:dihydroneopterin aldolase [Palleronia pontilimi]MBJ3763490.1 dihydroneopterin aldolase [Palleronia pontilimi]
MKSFKVVLEELEINMYLGIHQFEKDAMQRVLVSAEIDIEVDAVDGDLYFDYDAVADHIRSFNGERVATQEELTSAIHGFISGFDTVRHARVHSKKPDVYGDCKAVGIVFQG